MSFPRGEVFIVLGIFFGNALVIIPSWINVLLFVVLKYMEKWFENIIIYYGGVLRLVYNDYFMSEF